MWAVWVLFCCVRIPSPHGSGAHMGTSKAGMSDGMSEIQPWLQSASSWALPVLLDSVPMESCSLELSPAAWWEQETGAGVRTGGQDHFMH